MMMTKLIILLLIIFSINVINSYKININKNSALYSNNNNDNKIANNDLELQNQLDLYISKNLLLEQGIKLMRAKLYDTINENVQLKTQLSNIINLQLDFLCLIIYDVDK